MSENGLPELTLSRLVLLYVCGAHGITPDQVEVLDGCPKLGVIVDTLVYVPDEATARLVRMCLEVAGR